MRQVYLTAPVPRKDHKRTAAVKLKNLACRGEFDGIILQGKIYFHNLSEAELGLLLLSVEVKQLRECEKYREIISEYTARLEKTYELLGGAKA